MQKNKLLNYHKSLYIKLIDGLTLLLVIYILFFISLHFITPNLDGLTITVVAAECRIESKIISITNTLPTKTYYLLIYEEDDPENWLYFSSPADNTNITELTKLFLPDSKANYVLLEGSKTKTTFPITITSKYPIQSSASQSSIFHVEYIVPFKIFPFPTFYYSKHYSFFVDHLI